MIGAVHEGFRCFFLALKCDVMCVGTPFKLRSKRSIGLTTKRTVWISCVVLWDVLVEKIAFVGF